MDSKKFFKRVLPIGLMLMITIASVLAIGTQSSINHYSVGDIFQSLIIVWCIFGAGYLVGDYQEEE